MGGEHGSANVTPSKQRLSRAASVQSRANGITRVIPGITFSGIHPADFKAGHETTASC